MAEFQQISRGRNRVDMRLWMDIPKRPEEIAQPRVWNKFVKDSVKETLAFHHNKHMPRHFKREAREKYKHKPRSEKYKAWKKRRFGSLIDLVMTGSTRDKLTRANGYDRIAIGGAAEGGKKPIEGKLSYTFGFNDKLKAFYIAKTVKFHGDPLAARAKQASKEKTHRQQNPNRVSLRDMRAELQTISPDEADALRQVFETSLWGKVNAYRAGRKRVGRK